MLLQGYQEDLAHNIWTQRINRPRPVGCTHEAPQDPGSPLSARRRLRRAPSDELQARHALDLLEARVPPAVGLVVATLDYPVLLEMINKLNYGRDETPKALTRRRIEHGPWPREIKTCKCPSDRCTSTGIPRPEISPNSSRPERPSPRASAGKSIMISSTNRYRSTKRSHVRAV